MDTTASSFSTRSNAKRAAGQMLAKGTAPAVDYCIKPRDNGRFEIIWKTARTTGEVDTQISAAAAEDNHCSTNPSKMVARYRRDLLALYAAAEATQ
jgi:hypothetical protein